jgi:hypothetical protein
MHESYPLDAPFSITEITGTSTNTAYANMGGLYSTPVLLDTIVKEDAIELVYKRQYQVSNNWGMTNPEVYKEIYSRTDGTIRVEQGRYIPAEEESYDFLNNKLNK